MFNRLLVCFLFCRKEFNGDWFNGKIICRSIEGLASDAKPRYRVKYEDEDEEELYVEEILPLLKVCSSLSSLSLSYTRAPPHTHITHSQHVHNRIPLRRQQFHMR